MLSDYAIAHMRLIEIDRRFEAVIQRHPLKDTINMRFKIESARIEGAYQRVSLPSNIMMFNIYFPR